MHLAQFNVARLLHPLGDPRVAEFEAAIDELHSAAERSPGFIWRRVGDPNRPGQDLSLGGDRRTFATLSVWQDVEALKAYVFASPHSDYLARRTEWFEKPESPYLVLWWIREGHQPTISEANARLRLLGSRGAGKHAFGWSFLSS